MASDRAGMGRDVLARAGADGRDGGAAMKVILVTEHMNALTVYGCFVVNDDEAEDAEQRIKEDNPDLDVKVLEPDDLDAFLEDPEVTGVLTDDEC